MNEANPYEPLIVDDPETPSRPWFRWRVLPAGLSLLMGLGMLLAGLNLIIQSIMELIADDGGMLLFHLIPVGVAWFTMVCGGLCIWSATAWWRGRWGLAVTLYLTAGLLPFILATLLVSG